MSNFLEKVEDKGYKSISMEDVAIPYLNILQQLSPECIKGGEEYNEKAEPGMFFNNLSGKIYGTKISLIPLKFEKVWLEFKPDRQGFVAKHLPNSIEVDKSDFSKWKAQNGNIIVETYSFYCLIDGEIDKGPVIFSLTSSGIKHAKNWNSQILMTRLDNGKQAPFFSSVWELETKLNKNDQGSWYTLGIKNSAIKRTRYITENEYNNYIKEALISVNEMIKNIDYNQYNGFTKNKIEDKRTKILEY